MCFYIVLEYKQNLKTLIFMENWSRIAYLALKLAKRPQGPRWDPQGP